MKFGQLIEYKNFLNNNFLERPYKKCGGKSYSLDSFLKRQNWAYMLISSLKFYTVCFYCIPIGGLSKYIETKLQTTCFYLILNFLKNKKRSGTSFSASFCTWFLEKNFYLVRFYEMTKFHFLVAFTSWDIGQCVYYNCLLARLWRIKFWS